MRPFYILIFEFLNLIDLRYRVRTVGNIFDLVRMFFLKKCGVKIGLNQFHLVVLKTESYF